MGTSTNVECLRSWYHYRASRFTTAVQREEVTCCSIIEKFEMYSMAERIIINLLQVSIFKVW